MRNRLYPVMPFVPIAAAMQNLLQFNKLGLRPSRGVEAITGVTFYKGFAHNGWANALLGLYSSDATSVSGWAVRTRMPLAMTALAILRACVTVISALKKML